MQNDKIYSEIVSSLVKTKYEANLLLAELDMLNRSLYKLGEEDFEHTLEKGVRAKTAYAVSKAVIGAGKKEEILRILKEKVDSLTYLGLTIAFEPSLEVVTRIHTWVRQNLGIGIAIDVTIDKTILAGAIIEYKGKIFRHTLLTAIDKYFLDNNVNV